VRVFFFFFCLGLVYKYVLLVFFGVGCECRFCFIRYYDKIDSVLPMTVKLHASSG